MFSKQSRQNSRFNILIFDMSHSGEIVSEGGVGEPEILFSSETVRSVTVTTEPAKIEHPLAAHCRAQLSDR